MHTDLGLGVCDANWFCRHFGFVLTSLAPQGMADRFAGLGPSAGCGQNEGPGFLGLAMLGTDEGIDCGFEALEIHVVGLEVLEGDDGLAHASCEKGLFKGCTNVAESDVGITRANETGLDPLALFPIGAVALLTVEDAEFGRGFG